MSARRFARGTARRIGRRAGGLFSLRRALPSAASALGASDDRGGDTKRNGAFGEHGAVAADQSYDEVEIAGQAGRDLDLEIILRSSSAHSGTTPGVLRIGLTARHHCASRKTLDAVIGTARNIFRPADTPVGVPATSAATDRWIATHSRARVPNLFLPPLRRPRHSSNRNICDSPSKSGLPASVAAFAGPPPCGAVAARRLCRRSSRACHRFRRSARRPPWKAWPALARNAAIRHGGGEVQLGPFRVIAGIRLRPGEPCRGLDPNISPHITDAIVRMAVNSGT